MPVQSQREILAILSPLRIYHQQEIKIDAIS